MENPVILLNLGDHDQTRGDVAGWRGLAREVAKKTGGRILYADIHSLQERYPDQGVDYKHLLHLFLEDNDLPDIVIGDDCYHALMRSGCRHIYQKTDINEVLSEYFLDESELVSHYLTPELLTEEGQKFDQAHSDIKKPLIAVFLVDPERHWQEDFTARLTEISAHYQHGATIYLCGSRRTVNDHFNEFQGRLKDSLKMINDSRPAGQAIDVLGYKFSMGADRNPYKGLIARADHFILWGPSQSMLSEPLMAGKTIHIYKTGEVPRTLINKGCVFDFNDCALDRPLMTRHFEPVNITVQLAEALIQDYQEFKSARNKDFLADIADVMNYPPHWHDPLLRLNDNYRAIYDLDEALKGDPDFCLAAAHVNGMVLRGLPEEMRYEPDVVLAAVAENRQAFRYMSEKAHNDLDLMKALLAREPDLCQDFPDKLLENIEFMRDVIARNWRVFDKAPLHCRTDEDAALSAITQNAYCAALVAKELYKKPDFWLEAMEREPSVIYRLNEIILSHRTVAAKALSLNGSLIIHCPVEYRDDEELALVAVQSDPNCRMFLSERLRGDKDFMATAAQKQPAMAVSMAGSGFSDRAEEQIPAANDNEPYKDKIVAEPQPSIGHVIQSLVAQTARLWRKAEKKIHMEGDYIKNSDSPAAPDGTCPVSEERPLQLVFNCAVQSGMGKYSDLEFPVRKDMPTAPPDWPGQIHRGSLNAGILPDGYPADFDELAPGMGIQKLDNDILTPAFAIPYDQIGNNLLTPSPDMPQRGKAQIWRASVAVDRQPGPVDTPLAQEFEAWAVRRVGSAYHDVIELMSDRKLRDEYGLTDGTKLTVTLKAG